jgi:hypothetical protein
MLTSKPPPALKKVKRSSRFGVENIILFIMKSTIVMKYGNEKQLFSGGDNYYGGIDGGCCG